ncbi:MAG TPA: hypothetical protein VK277_05840 [Acidimicrobiales bacterium]|nr:hypothetical protein [Acidimicrobiales bacterium]
MSAETEAERARRRFDPVLRQLLSTHLVEPATDVDGAPVWRLSEMAQERLAELSAPPPPGDKVVYFSHHCARCDQRGPTRRRGEAYVCDPCWAVEAPTWSEPAVPVSNGLTA